VSDQTMTIGDRELQRIGEYVKGNLREWLDQVAPHSVVTTQLLERSVRIEEELHAQREIMQIRFEAADRRFEDMNVRFGDMNNRFEDMNRRFSGMQWLIGVGLVVITTLMSVYEFIT